MLLACILIFLEVASIFTQDIIWFLFVFSCLFDYVNFAFLVFIDCISNVGRAWLHLGVLRLNLLLSCDDLDPVMKHHYRNSQLADKISSLKLEIQVSWIFFFGYCCSILLSKLLSCLSILSKNKKLVKCKNIYAHSHTTFLWKKSLSRYMIHMVL